MHFLSPLTFLSKQASALMHFVLFTDDQHHNGGTPHKWLKFGDADRVRSHLPPESEVTRILFQIKSWGAIHEKCHYYRVQYLSIRLPLLIE